MRRRLSVFALLIGISCFPAKAFADWAWFGAATLCSPDKFMIESVIESSGGNIGPSKASSKLTEGEKTIQCTLENVKVETNVRVVLPHDRGGCTVNGYVFIKSLKVGDEELLKNKVMINYCTNDRPNDPDYTRIEMNMKGGKISVRLCRATWYFNPFFENEKCEVTHLGEQKSTPSFNCEKASTKIEEMICASPGLSKLDNDLGKAYSKKLKESPDIVSFKQQQRNWLKERNKCADETCLKQAYENRMEKLSGKTH